MEKEPVHGESVWGVYLVTDDDPSYSTASATAIDRLTSCLPSSPARSPIVGCELPPPSC